MIQLVLGGAYPANPRLKRYCLRDPDVLEEIASRAGELGAAGSGLSERFSLVLHDLRMGGTWKQTEPGRLVRTHAMLCAHIKPEFARDLLFLDVGASDAVTTAEALRALRRAFGDDVQAYAADLNLWLLRYRVGPLVEYRAIDGEPIMARLGPIGIRLARQRRTLADDGSNALASFYLRRKRLRRAMLADGRISLVNPAARGEPGLSFLELDCLREEPRLRDRVTAIRASNVLNPGYFTPAQIEIAIGHFHAYLRAGGCLLISRNEGDGGKAENGSVWLKEGDGFRRVEDFGNGCEIAGLVDGWRRAAVSAGSKK
jgi:hypothetical protein